MTWLLLPVFIAMGMIGGQRFKGVRRFGIPGLATSFAIARDIKGKKARWRLYFLSLLSLVLSMGYGVNSWLMEVFKKDWIVRVVYGLILSIPFYAANVVIGAVASVGLAGAWSIRAGSFKVYKDYDFLIEDFIRYAVLGSLICYSLQ